MPITPATGFSKLWAYARLMRWHQLAGFYLILPSTLWGLAAAFNHSTGEQSYSSITLLIPYLNTPQFHELVYSPVTLLIIFTIGSLIMRSAGCIINDFWDIDIDPQVQRTKTRPLASGELARNDVLWLFGGLLVVALSLVMLLPPLTLVLSVVGVAGTCLYPLAKRFIKVPQLVLGLVFSWGTIMAWSAVTNDLGHWDPWLLWLCNIIWIISYDLQYALYDEQDDKRIGINSGALYFGKNTGRVIVALQVLLLILLGLRGWLAQAGLSFYVILTVGAVFFALCFLFTKGYVHRENCLTSFKKNHWFGWLILIGIIV
ncbi:MAG: 4-hydroxybenzoate octaprenyltransferase [Candidatus Portiera sp.]|nr:4-hydroxybenzoate octaprenyltransferase [Portiera sp.]